MELRNKILELINEAAETTGCEIHSEITDNSVLLETGLDSLGFAILVAKVC